MASSKYLPVSVLHGSTVVVDFPCTFCQTRDKKEVESANYCVDCDSNMCKACTKWHANFPAMASHQVVDISKARGTRAQKAPLPTQRCDEHHGKIIDKYCEDHDEVGCETCVSLYHRNCVHMKYVPKCAKGKGKSKTFQTVKQSTEKLLKELKYRKSSQRYILQKLDMAEAQSQQEVQDMRTRLHQYIDKLAKSESAKITSEYQKKKEVVQKGMKAVDDQIDATESISKRLNDFQGGNESEIFVYIKQGEKTERDATQILNTFNPADLAVPKYKIYTNIEKSLKDINSLGDFEKTVVTKLNKEVNVRTTGDASVCSIGGVCHLPDASIIIADWNNKSLKHIDTSFRVTNYLDMSSSPFDVCYTNGNNEVAATLFHEKKVQFARVRPTMRKTRSFSVGDICGGIYYSEGELFICCGEAGNPTGGNVRVFSLSGTALRTIQYNPAGRPLFDVTEYITVSSCGSKLHVTDGGKGVLATDRTGNLLATYTCPELSSAKGVCTLQNDDLLVCGYRSNNVMHVSRDGRKLDVVLRDHDGIVGPQTVCYDCVHSRRIVAMPNSDTMKLFDIKLD